MKILQTLKSLFSKTGNKAPATSKQLDLIELQKLRETVQSLHQKEMEDVEIAHAHKEGQSFQEWTETLPKKNGEVPLEEIKAALREIGVPEKHLTGLRIGSQMNYATEWRLEGDKVMEALLIGGWAITDESDEWPARLLLQEIVTSMHRVLAMKKVGVLGTVQLPEPVVSLPTPSWVEIGSGTWDNAPSWPIVSERNMFLSEALDAKEAFDDAVAQAIAAKMVIS